MDEDDQEVQRTRQGLVHRQRPTRNVPRGGVPPYGGYNGLYTVYITLTVGRASATWEALWRSAVRRAELWG